MSSGVLDLPSYTRFQIRNRFLAIHLVVERAIVLVVMRFSDPLTIMGNSDLSTVTDSIPKIS